MGQNGRLARNMHDVFTCLPPPLSIPTVDVQVVHQSPDLFIPSCLRPLSSLFPSLCHDPITQPAGGQSPSASIKCSSTSYCQTPPLLPDPLHSRLHDDLASCPLHPSPVRGLCDLAAKLSPWKPPTLFPGHTLDPPLGDPVRSRCLRVWGGGY